MASIVSRMPKGCKEPVYYYHHTYRVKLDPTSIGKGPGSGPSKVVSEDFYLGTAEEVYNKVKSPEDSVKEVYHKAFGLPLAIFRVIEELGIRSIINKHIAKRRQGLTPGDYIAFGVLAKLCAPAVSWNGFQGWLAKTVLPEKLGLDLRLLDCQNFWDHFDKVLPEKKVDKTEPESQDSALNDDVIMAIEEDLWHRILQLYAIPLDCILYDTTNCYTYFEPTTPSELAAVGKNKAGRHELRQIGISLAVTRSYIFPLLHMVFSGKIHDAKVFPENLTRMMHRLCALGKGCKKVILVMDKGNNSKENLEKVVRAEMDMVGSLVPSQHKELMSIPVEKFDLKIGELDVYEKRTVLWGIPVKVVVTYNQRLAERQRLGFTKSADKLIHALRETFEKHKRERKVEIREALERVHRKSRVAGYVKYSVNGRRNKTITIGMDKKKGMKESTFGKRILFSTDTSMNAEDIIKIYNIDKSEIEDAFKMAKDPDIIRLQPIRCWTDSKIRVYVFISMLALLVLQVMLKKLEQNEMAMSAKVLKDELKDIEEIGMLRESKKVEVKVAEMSSIQKQLFDIFGLKRYTKRSAKK